MYVFPYQVKGTLLSFMIVRIVCGNFMLCVWRMILHHLNFACFDHDSLCFYESFGALKFETRLSSCMLSSCGSVHGKNFASYVSIIRLFLDGMIGILHVCMIF